ncbi:dihydrofolate reductase family protein [Streptomyces sp. PTM05]|uniref:Dihydrofolate reductase family protein n=1 Tax=Streptantibioticus parmotrematis TaxID=2873249 RepID=A0ABS7QKF6_9ACTN|nr:dihydrofolate reductase family protein [Streptantibioticus parmotrematis]MBY8883670.1 dihydrofolate reductase family protein [Streptantibioticus parmotrematis]
MRIVVINHVTLDGVMQGPGRRDEDTRDGFTQGGWAAARGGDEAVTRAWGRRLAASSGYLMGRRTYQDVLAHWNTQDSPFRDALNNAPKYVASNTLAQPLPWPRSTLLSGDIPAAIAELKRIPGHDLHIMGSGALIQSLSPLGLIDEYLLCVHPLVLGTGHRLFTNGFAPTTLDLADAAPTATGVIIASYRPRT